MTLAAYQEAIAWSFAEGVPVGLECDVQLTADNVLVCLHDPTLSRTSNVQGRVADWSVSELRKVDFGSWRTPFPNESQRSLVTLAELLSLVRDARNSGAEVTLAIETKHDQSSSATIEQQVCDLLESHGWDRAGAPVRLITFSRAGVELLAGRVPELDRTLLVEKDLSPYVSGQLPDGVKVAGLEMRLLRRHPEFVARARSCGNEVHAWTVNHVADIRLCRDLGVTGITSDYPDRVLDVLRSSEDAEPTLVLMRPTPRRRRFRRLAA